ncbi:MAG: YeeE/YedE family protein [Nitrospirae bacterium]|nr:YeeE/YedE family protein [Nitrospirota bacterium]
MSAHLQLCWPLHRPEWAYINSTFWIGSFIGGIIFGFGMPFAGGCGSGTCWRSAEGGVKQIIAFTVMGITNSLFKSYMDSS